MNEKNENILVNILTRTHNRPKHFNVCRNSIYSQTYRNINWIVGSDVECNYTEHIKLILDNKITEKDNYGSYFAPWNLHLNVLGKQVKDGWVMYIDDDDKFTTPDSLSTIVNSIENDDQLIIWKVNINGTIIPDNDLHQIMAGNISGIGFMFHSKYLPVNWGSWNFGDYRVINELSKKLNVRWIDSVLTQTQGNPNFGQTPIN